jgi:hypothetical protein
MIVKIEKSITQIQNYKNILISNIVTGQIDIREKNLNYETIEEEFNYKNVAEPMKDYQE